MKNLNLGFVNSAEIQTHLLPNAGVAGNLNIDQQIVK